MASVIIIRPGDFIRRSSLRRFVGDKLSSSGVTEGLLDHGMYRQVGSRSVRSELRRGRRLTLPSIMGGVDGTHGKVAPGRGLLVARWWLLCLAACFLELPNLAEKSSVRGSLILNLFGLSCIMSGYLIVSCPRYTLPNLTQLITPSLYRKFMHYFVHSYVWIYTKLGY